LCENVPEELCTLNGRREEQFYESCDNIGCFALKSTINVDTNQLMKYKINFPVDEFEYNNQLQNNVETCVEKQQIPSGRSISGQIIHQIE
jgi:hypothetical protein